MMAGTPILSHSSFRIWAAFSSSGDPAMRVKPIFSSSSHSRFPQISMVSSSLIGLREKPERHCRRWAFASLSYTTLIG